MTIKNALLLSALCAVCVSPVQAGTQRSVDARDFDVAGVKTGMDYNEALAAAARHLQVPVNQLKQGRPELNRVTQTKLPDVFTYENNGVRLMVHFEGRVPVDKARPLAVSQVSYEIPWTVDNKDAMAKAVVQKYGTQSNYPNDLALEWCAEPSSNPGMGCSINMTQAVLSYTGVSIKLYDPAWTNARMAFVDRSKATKPSF